MKSGATAPRQSGMMGTAMHTSGTCTKCRSTDTIRIPGEARAFGAGNNIAVGATIFSAVKVTRYVCASCGFSEEWIDSAEDLAALRKKYAP